MNDKFVNELSNYITEKRYVNLYSNEFSREVEDRQTLDFICSKLEEEDGRFSILIDIKAFDTCEEEEEEKKEEEEAKVILELINRAIGENRFMPPLSNAMSITDALDKLSKTLDRRCLMIFHCFSDIYDEKEKDVLRAIRKFIEIFEKSFFLRILIISDRQVHHWELYPESKLDDRHVAYKEYPSAKESQ